ncbi:uncharacterized protein LOC133532170 isoform X2 [Cydia pomonella]|uniref:uncharacterized protein LOC133532170 isoform X2 n=1 Tax=Cydia pomonella TaxID=82600 RepID=UPI002ADDF275|nr:uncharacterized protein LOC133532170 isoform X2 [Cydia pomonella]
MFKFPVLILCFQACLIRTAFSQSCGCNQYGGTGTGQVGVSGNIDACGNTCVDGSVPVLGSVDFGGCALACGTVIISGQCGCDCQSEQTLPTASTYIPSGSSIGTVAAVQQSAPITPIISQSSSVSKTSPSISTTCVYQNSHLSQSAPSQSLSAPRASISQITPSLTLSIPSTISSGIANEPRASLSNPRVIAPSINFNSGSGSYGGAGTGQTGVSGDIDAYGVTCVEGAVPVRGSVEFSGCSPTNGIVTINGQCGCECD